MKSRRAELALDKKVHSLESLKKTSDSAADGERSARWRLTKSFQEARPPVALEEPEPLANDEMELKRICQCTPISL
jgi:hypothetical protein